MNRLRASSALRTPGYARVSALVGAQGPVGLEIAGPARHWRALRTEQLRRLSEVIRSRGVALKE